MKSANDIFKDEEPTTEAIQRMLATCDDKTEYIKGDMIYCRKCHEPRRLWLSGFGEYVSVMCSCDIAERDRKEAVENAESWDAIPAEDYEEALDKAGLNYHDYDDPDEMWDDFMKSVNK